MFRASNFRSACERAGLRLEVDCPPPPEPVVVDRDMWEKVILNLLSKAFKFTFEGRIAVTLRAVDGAAELVVRDTGTGIPAAELPRIFERFHRIEDARARTHEGAGIGLALVRELVRLHGGTIGVESAPGEGTAFTVRVSFGAAHLPADRVDAVPALASTATRAEAFVEEALGWLSDSSAAEIDSAPYLPATAAAGADRPRVLLADDNADMREHVRRILAPRFEVEAVGDGRAALTAAEARRPDLLLADVMMPGLDGFALLRAVRSSPALRDLPVFMLSARAGEEARVEGLEAGADDYLVKPFNARELLARVTANLDMARLRREAAEAVRESEARFRALVTATSYVVYRMSPDWAVMRQFDGRGFLSDTAAPDGGWLAKYIHPDDQPRVLAAIGEAIRARSPFELEHQALRADGSLGWTHSRAVPIPDGVGGSAEWFGAASDVTARRRAEEALRESEAWRRSLADAIPQLVWTAAAGGELDWAGAQWTAYTGLDGAASRNRAVGSGRCTRTIGRPWSVPLSAR